MSDISQLQAADIDPFQIFYSDRLVQMKSLEKRVKIEYNEKADSS